MNRPGRPPAKDPRALGYTISLTVDERAQLEQMALADGVPVAVVVRRKLFPRGPQTNEGTVALAQHVDRR